MGSPVQEGPTLLPQKIVYFLQIRVLAVVVMLRFNVHELFVDAWNVIEDEKGMFAWDQGVFFWGDY
jgi:hypothetical protein